MKRNLSSAQCISSIVEIIKSLCMNVLVHRRSQNFLWSAIFFLEKVDALFSFVVLNTQAKTAKLTTSIPSKSPPPSKNVLKHLTFCPTLLSLTTFSCKSRPKFFFSPWGMHVHPLHPWLSLCALQIAIFHRCSPNVPAR